MKRKIQEKLREMEAEESKFNIFNQSSLVTKVIMFLDCRKT